METGLLDIEHTIKKNKVNLRYKMETKGNNLTKDFIKKEEKPSRWKKEIEELMTLIQKDLKGKYTKQKIRNIIHSQMEEKITKEGMEKSKVKTYMQENQQKSGRKPYLNKLNRLEVSMIIKARARMLNAKMNYKGKYKNLKCRFCKETEETQVHILDECKEINRAKYPKTHTKEIFNENITVLKETAKKLREMEKLLSVAPAE